MNNKYSMELTRQEAAIKLAALDGRTLEPHDGFSRGNDGNWILPIRDGEGEVVGTAQIFFLGKAKKGAAYCAPDPEGQRIANEILAQFNRPTP